MQISDALARMVKYLANVTTEAEHRKPVLEVISGLQSIQAESEWLATYENDPHKYKVRQTLRFSHKVWP